MAPTADVARSERRTPLAQLTGDDDLEAAIAVLEAECERDEAAFEALEHPTVADAEAVAARMAARLDPIAAVLPDADRKQWERGKRRCLRHLLARVAAKQRDQAVVPKVRQPTRATPRKLGSARRRRSAATRTGRPAAGKKKRRRRRGRREHQPARLTRQVYTTDGTYDRHNGAA